MRTVLLFIPMIFLGSILHAQTQKVTIYCDISLLISGPKIDYYGAEAFLPDSIKGKVLINYKDQYHFRNADIQKMILMMSADGWKLWASPATNTVDYLLSREISMDEPTRQLYLKKIGDTFKSAH